ncbi:exo-alpha-sialidase [Paenibacillus mesophilus]|nr:exo-alpha-sialidase [Paenibacillus mesophilus]
MLAAWFGGTAEGALDVGIWASLRSSGEGGGWGEPQFFGQ